MEDELEQPGAGQDSGAAAHPAAGQQNGGDIDLELNPDPDSEEQLGDEEDEEIEVDGKKFALPKSAAEKLKAERLMHADYTRKTQEVAARRDQVEAQAATVEKQYKEQQTYIADYAKVVAIQDQLAELNKINLADFVDSDPVGVQRIQVQKAELERKFNEAAQAVTQKQHQFALEQQQSLAKQAQEASAYVAREIPGWSAERDNQLQKYVQEVGIPQQELMPLLLKHPALFKVLHQAELYAQLAKKQQTTKPKPPTQDKPVTQVTAARSGRATRDPSKMSTAEWMAHRNSQVRKSR